MRYKPNNINQNQTDSNLALSAPFMSSNSVYMFSFWNQSIRKYLNDTIICTFFYLIDILPFSSLFSELGLLSSPLIIFMDDSIRLDKRTHEEMLYGKTNIDNGHRKLLQTTAYLLLSLSPLFVFLSLSLSLSLFLSLPFTLSFLFSPFVSYLSFSLYLFSLNSSFLSFSSSS